MPEPLTTLYECANGHRVIEDRPGLRMLCRKRLGEGYCWRTMTSSPVFSAGDMQAAQERAEEAEQASEWLNSMVTALTIERDRASAAADEFEMQANMANEAANEAGAREVELAEALRDLIAAAKRSRAGDPLPDLGGAIRRSEALLAGSPRSLEVVPLGTQEALERLLAEVRAHSERSDGSLVPPTIEAAAFRVRALVEGVERTPTPADERPPLLSSARLNEVMADADVQRLAVSREQALAVVMAVGVESLFPEPPAGEPSPSGITDEQVEAAALALAGPSPFVFFDNGPWPEEHHRDKARKALTAAFELQAGERTRTPVPNDGCERARVALLTTSELARAEEAYAVADEDARWALAFEAAARSEHPVQWPETGGDR